MLSNFNHFFSLRTEKWKEFKQEILKIFLLGKTRKHRKHQISIFLKNQESNKIRKIEM